MVKFNDEFIHKALSSNTRRELLISLADKDKYLSEIASELEKKPQTIDFHLNLLEEIGLVESEWRKGKKYYSLKNKKILEFLRNKKPIPPEHRPKPPHEIILDMWEDMKKRLDNIDKRLSDLEKK